MLSYTRQMEGVRPVPGCAINLHQLNHWDPEQGPSQSREGQPCGLVGHVAHGIPGPKCVLGFLEQETIYRPVTTPVGKELLYVLFQSLGRQV